MIQIKRHQGLSFVAVVGALAAAGCGLDREKAGDAAHPDGDAAQAGTQDDPAQEAAATAASMPSETKTFRDWFAVCDNGNDCTAFGPALGDGTGWVRVRMPAGPEARPEVQAGFWPNDGEFGQSPVRVVVDGRALRTAPPSGGDQDVTLSDPIAAVAALVAGRSMSLVQGPETQRMNLTGASAALLWIDERQGRLDTVTALVRKDDKPASAVRPVPDLPVVVAASEISQGDFGDVGQTLPASIEVTAEAKACRADTAHSPVIQREIRSARLDDRTELWAMPCFIGAYNLGTRWFLTGAGGANPRPLSFKGTGEAETTLINAEYSPHTRTLSQFAKGRGIGDCGVATTWTWTGRAFVLSEETVMGECWGAGADRWPTTWRTRSR